MKISIDDERWLEYNSAPNSGSYKGYSTKGTIRTRKNSTESEIEFTNGDDSFTMTGETLEQTYINAFDRIDLITK